MTTFVTFNPSDNWGGTFATPVQPGGTLSVSNLNWTSNADQVKWIRTPSPKNSGKYYFEGVNLTDAAFHFGDLIGVMKPTTIPVDDAATGFVGIMAWYGLYFNGANVYSAGTAHQIRAAVAVNLNTMMIWFRHLSALNWNNNALADPATGVGGLDLTPVFPLGTMLMPYAQGAGFAFGGGWGMNFGGGYDGGGGFAMAVPSGFTAGWPLDATTVTQYPPTWTTT